MSHAPARLIGAIALAAIVSLCTTVTALGADRAPVTSVRDTSRLLVISVHAVDVVVVVMDAQIDRIIGSLPEGQPAATIVEALTATRGSLTTLIATIDTQQCGQGGPIGSGDAILAGGLVSAADQTTTQLANRLRAVRAVLAETNRWLVRIVGTMPPGPPVRELDDALTAVRISAAAGFDAITVRIGGDLHPPSPCHSA